MSQLDEATLRRIMEETISEKLAERDEKLTREIIQETLSAQGDDQITPSGWFDPVLGPVNDILRIVTELPNDILVQNPINVHDRQTDAFTTLGKYGEDSIDYLKDTLKRLKTLTEPGLDIANKVLDATRIKEIWDLSNDLGGLESIFELTKAHVNRGKTRVNNLSTDELKDFLHTCKDAHSTVLDIAGKQVGYDFQFMKDNLDNLLEEALSVLETFHSLIPKIEFPINLNDFTEEIKRLIAMLTPEVSQKSGFNATAWNIAVPVLLFFLDLLWHILVNLGRSYPNGISVGCFGGGSVGVQGAVSVKNKPASIGNLIFALILGGFARAAHQGFLAADKIVTRVVTK